jgi:prepilin-type N-terminal cleavage/methylation domain-containing protein
MKGGFLSLRNQKGFTLIELLIVMAIIGTLVTIVIVAVDPVRQIRNSQDAKRRSDLQALKTALQIFYNDHGYYPTTASFGAPGKCWYNSAGSNGTFAADCSGAGTNTIYIRSVPSDPSSSSLAYGYVANPSGCDNSSSICTGYVVGAILALPPNNDDNKSIIACTQIVVPKAGGGTANATTEACND